MIIYKYGIQIKTLQEIIMPKIHNVLSVDVQDDKAFIWVEIDRRSEQVPVLFKMIMTGQSYNNNPGAKFIGTFQLFKNRALETFVGHLFELRV